MSIGVIPTNESVRQLLSQLIGPDVTITPEKDYLFDSGVVGVYVSETDEPLALSIADVGLAVLAGSVFLGIPASEAREMLTDGNIQSHVLQSYEEIANILTRTLSAEGSQHLRLDRVYPLGVISDLAIDATNYRDAVSFVVEIPNYGTGALTFRVR